MIIRAFQTFDEFNQTGLAGLFRYPATVIDIFIPLLLFVIYGIIFLGTSSSSKRLTGKSSFQASAASAGFVTAVIAVVMSLIDLVDPLTLSITIVVSILGVIFLFFGKREV